MFVRKMNSNASLQLQVHLTHNLVMLFFFNFQSLLKAVKPGYSRVPNKRTGHLLENLKKSHLYALIWDYTIINFQQKVPPIRLFPPIFSRLCQIKSMLAISFMNFSLTVL